MQPSPAQVRQSSTIARQNRKSRNRHINALVAVFLLALVFCGFLAIYPSINPSIASGGTIPTPLDTRFNAIALDLLSDTDVPPEYLIKRVAFAAVGDNLIHDSVYRSGRQADGSYNFDSLYAQVAPYIKEVDVAFLNQETICAGAEYGLSGYPTFNGPTEILDAVYNAGFTWINTASNHSLDKWESGLLTHLNHIASLPGLIQTGTNTSWEEANTPKVIEANGLRIGVTSYTYGLNGLVMPSGKEYLVNLTDTDRIIADYQRLKEVSDVQIVNMHWGWEYWHTANPEQQYLAQFLADLGYSVVIGEHPHVVQPTTMLTGANGNQTLVIYSLGNFMSAQDEIPRMLGEMMRWTLCYDPTKDEVFFEDIEIWPVVTHYNSGWAGYETYALKDYTDEMARYHSLRSYGLTRDYLVNLSLRVFGDEFKVVY